MKKILLFLAIFSSFSISSQIYNQNFEDATGGELPDGWTQVTNATDGGYTTSSDLTSQYFAFPEHTQYVGTNDDECNCDKANEQLISNLISLPSNAIPLLSFEYVLGQYYGEYAEVAVSTDGGTTNTVLSTLSSTNPGGTHAWTSHSLDLSAYAGQDINLVWIYQDNDGWGSGFILDDVSIAEVTCGQPGNLSVSNLTFSVATMSWSSGESASSYNIEYGAAGFELGSGMQDATSEISYALTDLDGQTNYDFYVQSDCDASGLSSWVGPFSFTTPPAPVACGEVVEHCYDVGSYIVFTATVENPGDVVEIEIVAGETEVGYDNLQIWDGIGNTGNLLYDADGDHSGVSIMSNTGTITMYIEGDGNYNCVDGLGGPYVPFEVNVNCFTPQPVDMELTELTMESLVVAGANNVTGKVTSYGTDPITSIDITWNDGSGANTETFSVNMNFGDTYDFTHGTPLNTVGGETYNVEVTVTATDDADDSNNTLTTSVSTVSSLVTKVVVGEEKTGEWCGWCPRGAVGLAEATLSNPEDFIGIAIHNGDAMAVASYDGNIEDYIPGGYPGGGVDRVITGDPSEFTAMYNARNSVIVPASVEASGTYDDNTITVNIIANFVGSLSGDYRLAAVILEDSVLGAGQANYYSGGGAGSMVMPNTGSMPNYDFANGPETVSPFYHDHVARALGDDEINGAAGSLPSTNSDGDVVIHTYTFNRNSDWNVDKLHVVGMLVNASTGEILNAGIGDINPPCDFYVVTNSTNASCLGVDDGTATVNTIGGTSPFDYSWSNGQTVQTASGLSSGTYSVFVTDANNCVESDVVTIDNSNTNFQLEFSASETIGSVPHTVTFTNLTPNLSNYDFTWNFGDGSMINSNGSNVSHTYTSTGLWNVSLNASELGTGCEDELIISNYIITSDAVNPCTANPLQVITNATDPTSCEFNNGTASVNVNSGTPPYAYIWSNGQNTPSIDGLSAGDYSIVVTDANSCVATSTVTINELNDIILSITTLDPEDCATTAIANVSGGSGSYSYVWSNGLTTPLASNLYEGNYTLTVLDDNNCEVTETISISGIDLPELTLSGSNPTGCGVEDGSINAQLTGGASPYSYNWSNGEDGSSINALIPGAYQLTVEDANGCEVTEQYELVEPEGPSLSLTATDPSNCDTEDGIVESTVSGGTGSYSYLWENGETTPNLTTLSSGFYALTVTDESGCVTTESVSLSSSEAPELFITSQDVSCFGLTDGVLEAFVEGGVSPYSYSWSNGENTEAINDLSIGEYVLTVTDANDCVVEEAVSITSPEQMVLSFESTNTDCPNGVNGLLEAEVNGGEIPYTYQWSNGGGNSVVDSLSVGDYTLIVQDANGCEAEGIGSIASNSAGPETGAIIGEDQVLSESTEQYLVSQELGSTYYWSVENGAVVTGQGTNVVSVLWVNAESGTLTVVETDGYGCEGEGVVLNVEIGGSDPCETDSLELIISVSEPSGCGVEDGAAQVEVLGGTLPYTYYWDNSQTTPVIENLSPGEYSVTVTDANGCFSTETAIVNSSNTIELSIGTLTENCAITAVASVSGGEEPYTYQWSNGEITQIVSDLEQGEYNLIVTDSIYCSAVISISIPEVELPILFLDGFDPSGCDTEDGEIYSNIFGGQSPYSFTWDSGDTTSNIYNLSEGNYTLSVIDDNGCEVIDDYELFKPESPYFEVYLESPSDCQTNDGDVYVEVYGDSAEYEFEWDNGDSIVFYYGTSLSIDELSGGIYFLTVTDELGCSSGDNINISSLDAPLLEINTQDVSCYGLSNGQAEFNAYDGVGPYSYFWEDDSVSTQVSGLSEGEYLLTVIDADSCFVSELVVIDSPEEIEINFITTALDCPSGTDGNIEVVVTGGIYPYSYLWSNGSDSSYIDNLLAGVYSLNVTDDSDCSLDSTITLASINSGPQTGSIVGSQQVELDNENKSYFVSQTLGSTYTWVVQNGIIISGQGTNVITVQWTEIGLGLLSVVETDENGCIGIPVTFNVIINLPIGIISNSSDYNIKVYPNPTNGDFTIDVSGFTGEFDTELLDIMGRTLLRTNNNNMSLNDYPDGLYFLRVYFDGKVQDIRLIKN